MLRYHLANAHNIANGQDFQSTPFFPTKVVVSTRDGGKQLSQEQ